MYADKGLLTRNTNASTSENTIAFTHKYAGEANDARKEMHLVSVFALASAPFTLKNIQEVPASASVFCISSVLSIHGQDVHE